MPSLSDLLNMGKQYVKDAMPGGLLNPEVTRQSILDGAALSTTAVPVLGDLLGLGADINRYATDPESRTAGNFALSGLGMLPFVPAMTAWHGSPHKFDKFSLDKIGTGEGNQSYGHGLYLAENPAVATEYQRTGGGDGLKLAYDGEKIKDSVRETAAKILLETKGDKSLAAKEAERYAYDNLLLPHIAEMDPSKISPGNLYKLDIPDEAAARFLDFENPVNEAIRKPLSDAAMKEWGSGLTSTSGSHLYDEVMQNFKWAGNENPRAAASEWLSKNGTAGMRYLDNVSRSAGGGTSNFVAFDPEMIRILERNGQPTGLEPWKPGEYSLGGLLGR